MLNLNKLISSKWFDFVLILILYITSIIIRLPYYFKLIKNPNFIFNKTLIINNVDGYYYANGAKYLLNNFQLNLDLTPIKSFISILTYLIVKTTPFNLDQVILFMPLFFSSLIVIPMYLLGKTFNNKTLSFLAAFIIISSYGYYTRNMIGYYDTDMLILFFLLTTIYLIIQFLNTQKNYLLLLLVINLSLFRFWYPQSNVLLFFIILMLGIYLLIFERALFREKKIQLLFLLYFINLSDIAWYLNLSISLIIYNFFDKVKNYKFFYYFIFIFLIVMLYKTNLFNQIVGKINGYINHNNIVIDKLHYYSTMKTIKESQPTSWNAVVNFLFYNKYFLIIAFIGYILFIVKNLRFIITLPFVMLGFLSVKMGIRFTMYAIPFLSIGYLYSLFFIFEIIKQKLTSNFVIKCSYFVFTIIFTALISYFNIKQLLNYIPPPTIFKPEINSLIKIKKLALPTDYTISWWDYGYPIRYYSNTRTFIDGSIHSGDRNFLISYILTQNQDDAARLMRIIVEFNDLLRFHKIKFYHSFLETIMKYYNVKNPYVFFNSLNKNKVELPQKHTDVYLYLPYRMYNIFNTISLFSWINLLNGKEFKHIIIPIKFLKKDKDKIYFTRGIILNKDGYIISGKDKKKLNTYYIFSYNNQNKYNISETNIDKKSNIFLLWNKSLNIGLIVDKQILNSTFIQMFFFKNYNKKYYQLIYDSPFAMVFKLKI